MASQKTKFSVGLFVASGIGITLLAVIWLGMSRYLEKGTQYATYFNESVQGLSKDSPVKYRGVTVGRVDGIDVAPDSNLIQVIMSIESGYALDNDTVAQLKNVGITGSMFIELDRRKPEEPDRSPPITFPSKYPIVASEPSDMSVILQGIDDVLKQVGSLDLKGISEKIKVTLDHTNQVMADANIKAISGRILSSVEHLDHFLASKRWENILVSLDEVSASLKGLVHRTDKGMARAEETLALAGQILTDNRETLKRAVEGMDTALKSANTVLEKGASLVEKTDVSVYRLRQHLLVVAQNLEKASENLGQLFELISDYPSQLVFGGPPSPREIEERGH